MKQCMDCHFHVVSEGAHLCVHPGATDRRGAGKPCFSVRRDSALCGPAAKWFEAAEAGEIVGTAAPATWTSSTSYMGATPMLPATNGGPPVVVVNVNNAAQPQPARRDNATTAMRYDANKHSILVAYLLWLFVGSFGVHRFYLGYRVSGIVMLLLLLFSLAAGGAPLVITGIWLIFDAFLIPGMAKRCNNRLLDSLEARGRV